MKKYFKRYIALVLTFALVLAVPFAFTTQKADAASKKKSKKVVLVQLTKEVGKDLDENGKLYKYTYKQSFNKRGFVTKVSQTGKYGFKEVFKYNKKGYLKSIKSYDKKGKALWKLTVKMNKKGMPAVAKSYYKDGKKWVLEATRTFAYSGKTPVKVSVKNSDGKVTNIPIEFYEIDGVSKADYKYVDEAATKVKKDKKGRVVSETYNFGDITRTYKYTYSKSGYRIKEKAKYSDGRSWTGTYKVIKMSKSNIKIDQLNDYARGFHDDDFEEDAE